MISSKLKWGILSLFCIVFLVMGGLTLVFWKEMDQMTKFGKTIAKRQKNEDLIMGQVTSTLVDIMKTVGKGLILYPPQFKNVICAQLLGIVKDVKQVKIDPIYAPYNASILEKEEGGYHLFFRYDVIRNDVNTNAYHSHIGYAALDEYFFVTDVIEKVNTKSSFSEDPRVVRVGKSLFLSWNDVIDDQHYARSIHLGEWNPRKGKLEYITNLQQNINIIEKNWMPFEKKEKQEAFLSFVYGVYPHKIIDLLNPKKNEITYPQYKGYNALHDLKWSKQWGTIRGGTPARLVGKEYISFFHSSFKQGEKIWYVMGAYTFEAKFPHKITSITPTPILFPGIYTSELLNTADPNKYCIFPSGLAIEKRREQTLLHVSCGENDSTIKIVTIDYDKLRENMIPVK